MPSSHQALIAGAAATAVLLAGSALARAESPSRWSDSERAADLVYFGLYGGLSFASVAARNHTSDEDGSVSKLEDLGGPVGWTGGYQSAWWPNDFFGLDGSIEGFALTLSPDAERFDDCSGTGCRKEKVPRYQGFGLQVGPTVRGAVPLRYIQPNVGLGLMLPISLQLTEDPVSRLDQTAFDVGAAVRLLGGVNVLVARDWRIYADYRFDYRLLAVAPGAPLDDAGWLRHSVVLGFAVSPDGYQESPGGDKAFTVVMPLVLPAAGWIATAIGKGVAK